MLAVEGATGIRKLVSLLGEEELDAMEASFREFREGFRLR
jgi:hypothetical protein